MVDAFVCWCSYCCTHRLFIMTISSYSTVRLIIWSLPYSHFFRFQWLGYKNWYFIIFERGSFLLKSTIHNSPQTLMGACASTVWRSNQRQTGGVDMSPLCLCPILGLMTVRVVPLVMVHWHGVGLESGCAWQRDSGASSLLVQQLLHQHTKASAMFHGTQTDISEIKDWTASLESGTLCQVEIGKCILTPWNEAYYQSGLKMEQVWCSQGSPDWAWHHIPSQA